MQLIVECVQIMQPTAERAQIMHRRRNKAQEASSAQTRNEKLSEGAERWWVLNGLSAVCFL